MQNYKISPSYLFFSFNPSLNTFNFSAPHSLFVFLLNEWLHILYHFQAMGCATYTVLGLPWYLWVYMDPVEWNLVSVKDAISQHAEKTTLINLNRVLFLIKQLLFQSCRGSHLIEKPNKSSQEWNAPTGLVLSLI